MHNHGKRFFIGFLVPGNAGGRVFKNRKQTVPDSRKDRAGLAAVFVQELLGIPKEEIVEDYLKTNAYITADLQVVKDLAGDRMGERTEMAQEAAGWLFGARKEYLDAVYRSVKEAYGGMDGFIREALGISDAERAELQRRYLGESLS